MDRTGANFYRCVDMIKTMLDSTPCVVQLPIGAEDVFRGVIDLVRMVAVEWPLGADDGDSGSKFVETPLSEWDRDPALKAKAMEYRAKLVEQAVELDEEALMMYLDGVEPSVEVLQKCIRMGTNQGAFVPVLTGSAFKNKGVQPLLDAVLAYMPAPTDVEDIKGVLEDGTEVTRPSTDDVPFAGLAFKIMNDPFVGTLTFCRVYSGVLKSGTQVYNSVKQKTERVGRMLQMNANQRTEVKEARAGDIVALVGLKDTTTGETLCTREDVVILEKMDFPEPVIKVAVEPKTKADNQKMGEALNRLAAEDPSFRYSRDNDSGQTVIEGMGELHLEIIVDRMKREFFVECNVGAPEVSYREAITQTCEIDYTHKKQSGGSGQYAKIKVRFEPKTDVEGDFEFVEEIKGGAVPREYIPAVQKGIESVLASGPIAGFPVLGMKATLLDGAYHDVDSSTMAFEIAGRACCREGLRKGGGRLMEPLMQVDVTTPEEYMGDVIGDLNARRGMIVELTERGNTKGIQALVPLGSMFQYVSSLRGMSKGRAAYSMKLSKYDFVPPNIEKTLIEKFKTGVDTE
jgi:elongation factor G